MARNFSEGLVLLVLGVTVTLLILWELVSPKICSKKLIDIPDVWLNRLGVAVGVLFFVGVVIFVFVDCLTAEPKKTKNLLGLVR